MRRRPQNRGVTETRPPNLPQPGGSSLRDFEPLLPAESLILRAAAHGEIAQIGYRRPRAPGAEARRSPAGIFRSWAPA
jgi:hypothetical protein